MCFPLVVLPPFVIYWLILLVQQHFADICILGGASSLGYVFHCIQTYPFPNPGPPRVSTCFPDTETFIWLSEERLSLPLSRIARDLVRMHDIFSVYLITDVGGLGHSVSTVIETVAHHAVIKVSTITLTRIASKGFSFKRSTDRPSSVYGPRLIVLARARRIERRCIGRGRVRLASLTSKRSSPH